MNRPDLNRTAYRNQLVCAYSGFAFVLLFLIGFWPIAGFVPRHRRATRPR